MGMAKNKIEDVTEEQKQQLTELSVAGNSNAAVCWIKQNDFAKALKCCNKAIALGARNAKLLYRRGCAHNGLGDPDAALSDLQGRYHTCRRVCRSSIAGSFHRSELLVECHS